jgi:hypothetical protein
MQDWRRLVRMLQQRRIGFRIAETMRGSHHFVAGAGPEGEHPLDLELDWGCQRLSEWLNPLGARFLSNVAEGRIRVGGLVDAAPCRGRLDLRYFKDASIRYDLRFKGAHGRAYRYLGEKVNLRPWNLHRTHTTCYGTIVDLNADRDVSKSIVYFSLGSLPAMLASFRLG